MTYDNKYNSESYYWGKEPSASALNLLKHIKLNSDNKMTLLDLGCGEGRNAVSFAKNNFIVTAIDISLKGLDKTQLLACENKTKLTTTIGDIKSIILSNTYNIIFSSGTFHYLPLEIRQNQITHFQHQTKIDGINAINVFVEKPFLAKAPDAEETAYFYKSGELLGYYADWEILFSSETIFNCTSGGVPHRHAMNSIIAKKVL